MGDRTRQVDFVLVPMLFSLGLALVVAELPDRTDQWNLMQRGAGWMLVFGAAVAFVVIRIQAKRADAGEVVPEEQMRALYACFSESCDEGEHIGLAMSGQAETTEGVTSGVLERASKAISDWGFASKVVVLTYFHDRSVVSPFLRAVFPMKDGPHTWDDLLSRVEAGLLELRKIRDTMEARQVRMYQKVGAWSRYSRRTGSLIY